MTYNSNTIPEPDIKNSDFPSVKHIVSENNTKGKHKTKQKPTVNIMMQNGRRVTKNIILCEDGKYRWIYKMNLFTNPTIFLLISKIFFFIILGITLFTLFLGLIQGDMDLDYFISILKLFALIFLIFLGLIILGYLLYAAIMRGKYIVRFEMDEQGINHSQIESQTKKAKLLSSATIAAGIATRSLSTLGAGHAARRTSMYTSFGSVRKVKIYPMRGVIKLNELLEHNQVYTEKEDFDFVKNYILTRVSEKSKPKKFRNS